MSDPLPWGRRYLMCRPEHYGVLYEINPWMHREVPAEPARALAEWRALRAALAEVGAVVVEIEPVDGLPDMVFTANAGVIDGSRFVASRFRHPQRSGEEAHFARWFADADFVVETLEAPLRFEGAGDALPFGGSLLAGYRTRSDFAAHTALARRLGVRVLSVELVDPRFYHLDLSFCPLDARRALVVPEAWDRYGREVVRHLVPEPIVLAPEEALAFSANSVVVGDAIVMPSCSARLARVLEGAGFRVALAPVPEFLKAGGGVRCLTLALDVTLGR